MSRVPLPDASEITDSAPHLFESLSVGELQAAQAMGNAPHALAGLLDYMDGLYGSLPADCRELAILATARYHDSEYEWHQHVEIAQEVGIERSTIQAIGSRQFDALSPPARVVVEAVRAQCAGQLTDQQYDALAEQYSTEEIVALSMLVGHYTGVAQFIKAMELQPETEFVGWTPPEQ